MHLLNFFKLSLNQQVIFFPACLLLYQLAELVYDIRFVFYIFVVITIIKQKEVNALNPTSDSVL